MIFEGETIKITDEKSDADGKTWYKFHFHDNRDGWVSEEVVNSRHIEESRGRSVSENSLVPNPDR